MEQPAATRRLGARPWRAPDVIAVFSGARPGAEVLVRQVTGPAGWRRQAWYEVGYFPEGRGVPPAIAQLTRSPRSVLPRRVHTTDWGDLMQQVAAAWAAGDDRFVSFPL